MKRYDRKTGEIVTEDGKELNAWTTAATNHPGRTQKGELTMKTFEINDNEYTITTCTAIAECDEGNEDARQDALLVINVGDSGERFEYVVFGWDMPETAEDFADMCEDASAWAPLSDEHHIESCNGMNYEKFIDSIYGWLTKTREA